MNYRPMTFARYGVYIALALAGGSVLLSTNAGLAFDLALLRALLVFVAFTALAFGAEAVLATPGIRRPVTRAAHTSPQAPAVVEEEAE